MKKIILLLAIFALGGLTAIIAFDGMSESMENDMLVKKSDIGKEEIIIIENKQNEKIGTVLLKQGATGVLLEVDVKGLPKGKHGMHFHKQSICDGTMGFKTAKGHIAMNKKPSGYLNLDGGPHEGNLPNLIVQNDGTAHVELYSEMVSFFGNEKQPALFDADGSAIMIHINEDDHMAQPIGGLGARIACGVIKK